MLEIIHKDTQKQKSLAASIQAEYNGYIGSAEAKFEMKKETQQLTRALFTAFFLTHLTGTDKYRPLLEADVKRAPIEREEEPAH